MKKSAFKRAMQRGLGRCQIELDRTGDRERYRDVILWGCLRNLSFDTQCEGTRAGYLYEMAARFHDNGYFAEPVAGALARTPPGDGWRFLHLCELLRRFAADGSAIARNALYAKYDELHALLLKKRRTARRYALARDDFEALSVSLTSLDGMRAFLRIAADVGALFSGKGRYDRLDFAWFYDNAKNRFGEQRVLKKLAREGKTSAALRQFLAVMEADRPRREKDRSALAVPGAEQLIDEAAANGTIPLRERILFARRADSGEKRKLAQAALDERDAAVKAGLLSAFRHMPFPLACEPLLDCLQSDCEALREAAFEALELGEGECVHDFAAELLRSGTRTGEAVRMLLNNYRSEDQAALLAALAGLSVTYSDADGWHGAFLQILRLFDSGRRAKLPREFLLHIYEYSLCSCCRYDAVAALGRRGWLTAGMIEECAYDSNEDIRTYVGRYHKKKIRPQNGRTP